MAVHLPFDFVLIAHWPAFNELAPTAGCLRRYLPGVLPTQWPAAIHLRQTAMERRATGTCSRVVEARPEYFQGHARLRTSDYVRS